MNLFLKYVKFSWICRHFSIILNIFKVHKNFLSFLNISQLRRTILWIRENFLSLIFFNLWHFSNLQTFLIYENIFQNSQKNKLMNFFKSRKHYLNSQIFFKPVKNFQIHADLLLQTFSQFTTFFEFVKISESHDLFLICKHLSYSQIFFKFETFQIPRHFLKLMYVFSTAWFFFNLFTWNLVSSEKFKI